MKLKNVTMGQIKLLGRKEDESEDEKERVHLVRVWMPLKQRSRPCNVSVRELERVAVQLTDLLP